MAVPLNLHKDVAGRPVGAKHNRQADHPFTTDDGNLGLTPLAAHRRHLGGNPAVREIYVCDGSVRKLQVLPKLERHFLKMGLQQGQSRLGHGVQNSIAPHVAIASVSHWLSPSEGSEYKNTRRGKIVRAETYQLFVCITATGAAATATSQLHSNVALPLCRQRPMTPDWGGATFMMLIDPLLIPTSSMTAWAALADPAGFRYRTGAGLP